MENCVLIYGLGKSGIAAAQLLSENGVRIAVYDDIGSDVIGLYGAEDRRMMPPAEVLEGVSEIIVSPSVEFGTPVIKEARRRGIGIIGEIELGYRYCKSDIIAVTGTNGKTTTVLLLEHLLKACHINAQALGNIGIPLTSRAATLLEEDVVVLEVSSFQLESIETFRPKIGVCLNITPDHMERHKTLEEYIKAKQSLFVNMQQSDYAVLNFDDPAVRRFAQGMRAKTYFYSSDTEVDGCFISDKKVYFKEIGGIPEKICQVSDLPASGKHNLQNMLAAFCVCKILKFPDSILLQAARAFRMPRHRIERVAKISGKTYFNDSKATNIDATLRACEAMAGSTALILGGYDKGLQYRSFLESLPKNICNIIAMGENKLKIKDALPERHTYTFESAETLQEAVRLAAEKNVVNVLFSPSTSSFDQFKNYEERGDAFIDIIKEQMSAKQKFDR